MARWRIARARLARRRVDTMRGIARASLLVVLSGCTPAPITPRSSEHPSIAPSRTPQSAQSACGDTGGPASPWVVDATVEQRRALNRARSRGSMVFAYDCRGLRLLEGCRAPGSYTFAAITPQPQALQLDDTDSYAAKLPLTAPTAPLGIGESLRVEALTVGVWSSTTQATHVEELDGSCSGATHIARNVVVGAFTLHRGRTRDAPTAESSSPLRPSAELTHSCQGSPGASTGCDEAVSLALQPILAERPPKAWASNETRADTPPSHSGARADPSSCTRESMAACERGCQAGASEDCMEGAVSYVRARDDEAGSRMYQRACWLGHAKACGEVASVLLEGARPEARAMGHAAWRRACEGGLSSWCWALGMSLAGGQLEGLDGLSAYDAWELGCQHGSRESCYAAAQWRTEGGAGRLSVATLLRASCPEPGPGPTAPDAHWNGCLALAGLLERGEGVESQPRRAAALFERVCDMKIRVGCREAARMAEGGIGGPVNRALAERMHGAACRLGDGEACMRAAALAASETGSGAGAWYEEGCRRFKYAPACERTTRR